MTQIDDYHEVMNAFQLCRTVLKTNFHVQKEERIVEA